MPPNPLSDVLAKLRDRYAASAGDTLATFTRLGEELTRETESSDVVDRLRRELHRVHGTAGSYGFHHASRLAGALELVAVSWVANGALDAGRRGSIVSQFARALAAALDTAPPAADSPLARRLLLIGLGDDVALPLVAEGIHRGFFVERADATALSDLLAGTGVRGVIAANQLGVTLPDEVAFVLLTRDPAAIAATGARVRSVATTTSADEVLRLVESLGA